MRTQRQVVNYALQRRSLLAEVYAGRVGTMEVCDASPYLLRAAKFHGEATDEHCPVCRRENLTHVTYTYGDALGQYSGRIKATRELAQMETEIHEFTVYVVEVCQNCGWNHLIESYVLGHGRVPERATAARQRKRAMPQ